jgi:hypothetical protein
MSTERVADGHTVYTSFLPIVNVSQKIITY